MLSKSFKSGKCKTSLKLAISRIKLLKNRRDIQVKQLRRELAQLLETGQEQTARIRVEHVIREEKTMSAYDLIEIYCELIVARMPIIDSQKSCPIDLKEAITSVIFASPRCADIPELTDVKKQLVAKYGKEFVISALELRPDCGVNRMIVEKLSAKTPETEIKLKTLTAIAKEHEVKWDSKAFEEELQKPKEDLLNGSSSFTGANKMPMEPLNFKFTPNARQTESASKAYESDIPSKPVSFSSSSANLRTTPVVPPPAPNQSGESDGKSGLSEVRDSYTSAETAAFKQPTWRMDFKDAASAAQVAAESAERASIAARAAAELASRGSISRQNSNEPNRSSLHISRDENPKRELSSKFKGVESVNNDYDQVKGFQGMKEDMQRFPCDELREEISHHSSTSDEEYSPQMDIVRTFDSFRGSFSRMEIGNKKKNDEDGFLEKNVEVNYDGSAHASSFVGTHDDDAIWIPPLDKQLSDRHEINAREKLFRYDSKKLDSSDYPAAVFDEYDPEPADDKENLFDSFDKKQNDHHTSMFAPYTNSLNSSIFSSSHHENHRITVEKVPSSKFDDTIPVAFDDSDSLSSESDNGMSGSRQNGTAQNSTLLHEKGCLGEDLHSQQEFQPSSSTKAKPMLGTEERNHLQMSSSSGIKDSEMLDELANGGDFGLRFGRLTGGLRNRGYNNPPYISSSVIDSPEPSTEALGSNTKQIISPPFRSYLIEDEPSSNPIMPGASTNPISDKDKVSVSDEYNQGIRSNKTLSTDKSEEDTTGFSLKQSVSNLREADPNPSKQVSEIINQKIHDEKPRTLPYKELSSRLSETDFDSDVMEGQGNPSSKTTFKLSRRTKDLSSKGRPNLSSSVISNSGTESRPSRRSSAPELPSQTDDKETILERGTSVSGGGPKSQKASHVHPKLPDYETLAAHFQSLRSNRRQP
ncbi:uncharacterized protein LOC110025805 isoform X2 [Phalaenopsis equestris]|nr:uncharacterized protein LOC110025805 isoform X2 [Phalaenopsis equestris]XP_020582124.1 uncharacterized protein LOC110025805 isoform X2 [Phalaenopsis equestris]